jgi:glucose-6-phosphate 1-dehydrogenase
VCRIQPDEALYLKMQSKQPGLTQDPATTVLEMRYGKQFKGAYLADAYERMFLNAALGESALFVSSPEISEAWRIFTPLLHAIDAAENPPVVYPFGVRNPAGFKEWSKKYGVTQHRSFFELLAENAGDEETFKTFFKKHDADENLKLDYGEIVKLATKLYDGRTPEGKNIKQILNYGKCPANKVVDFEDLFNMGKKLRAIYHAGK